MENNLIIRDFTRPSKDLIERFKPITSSDIDDVTDRCAAFHSSLRPFGKGKLCGPAFTVKCEAGDNLVLAASLDMAKPGDVLVIEAKGETERALVGELLATYAEKREIQGMILDGAVRDIEALEAMDDFVVYASSISPNGPYKKKAGSTNVPVTLAGKTVHPGDIIVGDTDGIIVIPLEDAEEILEKAEAMFIREENLIQNARNGINPRPVTDEMLVKAGCIIK